MSADLSSTPCVCVHARVFVCVEKANCGLFFSLLDLFFQLPSAQQSWNYTGVFSMGGISAHYPAGTQQAAPERVRS